MTRKHPAAAKLVGAGSTAPCVYVRDRRGCWVKDCICDDEGGRDAVRRYEDVAAWAREEVREEVVSTVVRATVRETVRTIRAALADWTVADWTEQSRKHAKGRRAT